MVGPRIDYAAELNAQQYEAVTGPTVGEALVIAGAGSGKTRTLTYRVAWLLERGAPAGSILLLTFTNKAAREMLERVAALLPGAADGLWGGTFHSVGNRILRRHAEALGYRPGFSILDREDQKEMLDALLAREGLAGKEKRFPKGEVLADIFSMSINTSAPVGKVLAERYKYFIPLTLEIERIQGLYEGQKREANVMDFDDLLAKLLELFLTQPALAEEYRQRFHHVLVDEYQDTNKLQSQIVDLLHGGEGSLMVVGDDAQSIYSWRGADFENILNFPKRYPNATVYRIETNYRSTPEILELANATIAQNERQFPKELRAARPGANLRPGLVALATNNQQAAFVAQRVLELHEQGVDLREIAVLYRSHYHSLEVQLEFTKRGIPFEITSGLRFFEQAHIKDVAAFLKFAVNPRDEVAFKRMVRLLPGVGAKSAETLWQQTREVLGEERDFSRLHEACRPPVKARDGWKQLVHTLEELAPEGTPANPTQMIESVLFAVYDDYMKNQFANYESRREDLATLANYARQFEQAEDFLSQLALLSGVETADEMGVNEDREKVTLSTVHQAKGLEWRVVFVVWLSEGMFPSARSLENPESLEEERRLFYVAVTRGKDELYLTYPEFRLNAGYGDAFQRPSRFLQELPEMLMETWEVGPPGGVGEG